MSTLDVQKVTGVIEINNPALILSYDKANAANIVAASSFDKANTSNVVAVAAFAKANAALANSSTVFAGDLTITGNLTVSSNTISVNGNNISPVQSFRNKIINGNFDHWQRGTSVTGITSGQYLADRWVTVRVGTTGNVSRQSFTLGQTDVPGEPTYFHRSAVTSVAGAGNYFVTRQLIESIRTLAGQTATLSFWAKADASKNIAVEFEQYFGSGGSPSSSVQGIGVTTCALTTSWQKFTVTTTIPSISGKTLGTDGNDALMLNIWYDAGSNSNSRTNSLGQQSGTFDIAQVQLEAGSVATPFEMRPIGTELALCQRYYQTIPVNAYATNYYYASYNPDYYYPMSFLTQLRATPTLTRTSIADSGVTGGAVSVTTRGFSVVMQLTSAAGQSVFTAVADAEL